MLWIVLKDCVINNDVKEFYLTDVIITIILLKML